MTTTLIDIKNAFEKAGHKSDEAEALARVLDDYVKGDKGLATKVEYEQLRGELRLVKWMVGYSALGITAELVNRWFL